jgi:hypothetical protein
MHALLRSLSAMDADCSRVVGFTDRANGVFSIDGEAFDRWVSTYCFALSARALERLGRRILDAADVERFVLGGDDEERFLSDALSQDLHFHFRWWLFRGGWHGSARLTAANSARLAQKARCMLHEHLLTLRCARRGIEVVDPFDHRRLLAFVDRAERVTARKLGRAPAPPVRREQEPQ